MENSNSLFINPRTSSFSSRNKMSSISSSHAPASPTQDFQSFVTKKASSLTSYVPLRTQCIIESSKLNPKHPSYLFFLNSKESGKYKKHPKKKEKESRGFAFLPNDLSHMCASLLRDNLIIRFPKPRTSIKKGFDPHGHCLSHMDVSGHKIEDYWSLRHKNQKLTDAKAITIDLLNKKYDTSDHYNVLCPLNPPRHLVTILFL